MIIKIHNSGVSIQGSSCTIKIFGTEEKACGCGYSQEEMRNEGWAQRQCQRGEMKRKCIFIKTQICQAWEASWKGNKI